MAALDINKIIDCLKHPEKCDAESGYMYSDPAVIIRSLSLDLIAQLQPDTTFEELLDQTIKNLIFIARILNPISTPENIDVKHDNEIEENRKNQLSLPWLLRKLRKAVNVEITRAPKSTSVVRSILLFVFIFGTTKDNECSLTAISFLQMGGRCCGKHTHRRVGANTFQYYVTDRA